MRKSVGDLQDETHGIGQRQRAATIDELSNVHPFDVFEDDVVQPAIFTDVIHPRDVVVIESGGRLGFVLEAFERFVVGRLIARENLDGDFALQHRVASAEDGPHAAAAGEFEQLVMP